MNLRKPEPVSNNIIIPYSPFEYQLEFHKDESRFKVIAGGRRVGKTASCLQEAIKHCLESPNRLCFWVAPNYHLAKEVGFDEFIQYVDVLQPAISYIHSTQLKITFTNGSKLYFKGSDNPDSLRGRGLTLVIMDEAAFCKKSAWTRILRPALSDKQGRAILISTPNGHNWFKDIFDSADGWKKYHWPTRINPMITKEELSDVRSQISEIDYQQEYLAEFVTKAGRVYDDFNGENIIEPIQPNSKEYDIYIGMDFGFASRTAIVFMAVNNMTQNVIQFDELYLTHTQMDDIISLIEAKLISYNLSKRDLKYCYTDPAGNAQDLMAGLSPVDLMRSKGFSVINKGSTIIYGISLVRSFVRNSNGVRRFRVTRNCQETIRCFNGYQYDISRDGIIKEEALKDGVHDHLMDAVRYFFINRFDQSKYVASTPDQRTYTSNTNHSILKRCAKCNRPFISTTPVNQPPFLCSEHNEEKT